MEHKLSNIFWDYNYSNEELYDLLHGKISRLGYLTRADLMKRMLKYLNWFDAIKFINRDIFLTIIDEEFIKSLKEQDLQEGLLFAREYLLKKPLSSSR